MLFAMHAVRCQHVGTEKTDLAQEFRVRLSVARRGRLQLERCFRHVRCDQRVLLVGKLSRQSVALLVHGPDHVGRHAHLHASAGLVVALHLLASVADGVLGIFDQLARNSVFLAQRDESAADKSAHPGLVECFHHGLDHARARVHVHEIHQRCDAGANRFHAAVKRGGMRVLGRQVHAARRGHTGEPLLQHFVVAQALDQRLKKVRVRVHHARHDDAARAIHDFRAREAPLQILARAYRDNPVVLHAHAGVFQHLTLRVHGNQPAIGKNQAHRKSPFGLRNEWTIECTARRRRKFRRISGKLRQRQPCAAY